MKILINVCMLSRYRKPILLRKLMKMYDIKEFVAHRHDNYLGELLLHTDIKYTVVNNLDNLTGIKYAVLFGANFNELEKIMKAGIKELTWLDMRPTT